MWDYSEKVQEYFFNPKNAGVLAEATDDGRERTVVIGVGVNVNVQPEELADLPNATSLAIQAGHEVHRGELLALMIERLRLEPRMAIRYRRRALFGQFDPELRITFDGRILYHPRNFSLEHPFEEGTSVLDPRVTVLEIKYDHRAPIWLTKAIGERGLQIVRMSKYCTAVDKHYFGGLNT